MTYDTMFWLLLGAAFVLTGLIGVLLMWKTERLLLSFLSGTAVNLLISIGAISWWAGVFSGQEQQFSRMFGIFGLSVSLVNNEVLLFFALLAMKRKVGTGKPPIAESPDDYQ